MNVNAVEKMRVFYETYRRHSRAIFKPITYFCNIVIKFKLLLP